MPLVSDRSQMPARPVQTGKAEETVPAISRIAPMSIRPRSNRRWPPNFLSTAKTERDL
jgi:hypothetical protein